MSDTALDTKIEETPVSESEIPKATTSTAAREVPASTIVHLMGLATSKELEVLEAKIDAVTARITAVTSKIDRLGAQLSSVFDELSLERIESQLSEIRLAMKKIFPKALSSDESSGGEGVGQKS